MSLTSEQLAAEARRGHEEAAAELVQRFYQKIFAYLRRHTSSNEDAADLTQKVFSEAWRSLDSFKKQAHFSTWLYRIAHHTYVDWVRHQTRQSQRETLWWSQNDSLGASPSQEFEERDLAHRVYELVDQLEEKLRLPIHFHYYQQLTLGQTAEVLNISVSTVKNRLRAATALIKEQTTPIANP